jgi:DNA-binding transcriptional regulator YdaS (Cro superfamily)
LRNANISGMTLKEFLNSRPRGSLGELAKAIGAHTPDLSRWVSGERPIPVHRCMAIERATYGKVTRQELRPADWPLIWPELATTTKTAEGQGA